MLASALVIGATPAAAQDEDTTKRTSGQITVYGWLAGYGGDIRPGAGAPEFSVDKSFREIFEDLDGAFFAAGLIRRDRFVFMADLSHSSASKEAFVPTGLPPPLPPALPAEARLKQTSLTAVAGYRVADNANSSLDLLGGVRSWWVSPGLKVPDLGIDRDPSVNFVDPIIGARGNIGLGSNVSALVYADLGGFGVGSDFTAQIVGTLNARVSRSVWLSGGYRYLVVDYRNNGIKVDSRLGGPLLGVTFVF